MKYIFFIFIFGVICFFSSCSDMYETMYPYSDIIVYPAKFDTIYGHIGYERVEIDLLKAGRLPASEIKMGKAINTVIQYDQQKIVIDSLCSWVNITGLTLPKLYRFRIYTTDEFGNKSVPQEIALIPYTKEDKDLLEIPMPRVEYSDSWARIIYPAGISSVMLNFSDLSYNYIDKDGISRNGTSTESRPNILIENLAAGSETTVNMSYRVIPILNDNSLILDTLVLTRPLVLQMRN